MKTNKLVNKLIETDVLAFATLETAFKNKTAELKQSKFQER